jgi:hypothetical protein
VHAQTPGAWLAAQAAAPAAQRAHALAGILFELRQYAALLAAHRLPLAFDHGDYDAARGHLIETVAAVDPAAGDVALYAHEAPGLGIVAVSAAQVHGAATRVLAHGYPLTGRVDALREMLAQRCGCAAGVQPLGRIHLDADGRLGVPMAAVH